MYDFNISDHWSEDEPAWVKSLASSLDRRHGVSTVLPLTLIVEEVVNWVDLASGEDAWGKKQNRESLKADLEQSIQAVGATVGVIIDGPLKRFTSALAQLTNSPRALLQQPAGSRSDPAWTDVLTTAADLLECLDSEAAVGANWDDLVATAQERSLAGRQYRPIAELLFAQLTRRGLNADQVARHLVAMLAYGVTPHDPPTGECKLPLEDRIAGARAIAVTPAEIHPVVVWLGYHGRVHTRLKAGRVTFYDAHWAVPNAAHGGQNFDHKGELAHLVHSARLFKVAERVDEESEVDTLVRVDLGETHVAGASDRAVEVVDTILNVSLHFGGGIRPHLVQYGVMWDGQCRSSSLMWSGRDASFADDHYGADMTAEAVDEHGPEVADALAREQLPRFLSAALEVQTTADHPFSRDRMLRQPSQADISSVVPLADRVVQHVAAHAALTPAEAFETLGKHWPHARWLSSVRYAGSLCLVGGGYRDELRNELTREWYNPKGPWILFAADRAEDLLKVCRVESERAWIERMLGSISDYASYSELLEEYKKEGVVLEARRKRVRNALVHGNPAHFNVVTSVRSFSEFLSSSALHAGIESYVLSTNPAEALAKTTAEYTAMQSGLDCATYWRSQIPAKR